MSRLHIMSVFVYWAPYPISRAFTTRQYFSGRWSARLRDQKQPRLPYLTAALFPEPGVMVSVYLPPRYKSVFLLVTPGCLFVSALVAWAAAAEFPGFLPTHVLSVLVALSAASAGAARRSSANLA